MSEHHAELVWERGEQPFLDHRYSRAHRLRFDGGLELRASSSPSVVPVPLSDATAVDPEELFVASLSSCHMLWFLSLAAQAGLRIDGYTDRAVGFMRRDASGRMSIERVVLRPRVSCSGETLPTREEMRRLHERAHEECFIARSVKTEVACEPEFD
jgi:organic hydroperoxide reductase OsmC/OhrA